MIKIAVISDVHAGQSGSDCSCRGDIAEILLARAVYRLQRWIRPDIVLLLGDLVEADGSIAQRDQWERFARRIDTLTCPVLVIPGNHDPADELFYEYFPPPPEMLDVKGVRFLAFRDEQLPGCHARRCERDLRRMQSARRDFDGPIVSVQHVPLFPADAAACPFHYTNAGEIIEVMRRAGIGLAISGHYHEGMDLLRSGPMGFVVNPALCREPFSFLVLEMDGAAIRCERHSLQMPQALELFDAHVHTPLAYCNENMDAALALRLAEDFHLAGVGFAEHSSHLYFDRRAYGDERHLRDGLEAADGRQDRFGEYLRILEAADCPASHIGLEVECDYANRLLLRPADRGRVHYLIGAVHGLPERAAARRDPARLAEQFLAATEAVLADGIHVLAHPFRVFRRCGFEPPPELFAPVVGMLRRAGAAAEINFHTNEPPAEFFRLCLEAGVPVSFGGDAHHLREIGEFWPHLNFLRILGVTGNVTDYLIDPRRIGREG